MKFKLKGRRFDAVKAIWQASQRSGQDFHGAEVENMSIDFVSFYVQSCGTKHVD